MNVRSLTRAGFLAALTSAALLAAAPEAFAARNPEAEQYVQQSATGALETLADRSVSSSARHQTFQRLIAEFADMPRIAFFVLGRYSSQLRADPQLRADWYRTFQEYSIATYEDKLNGFSSSSIHVIGSVENVPGADVTVTSEMTQRGQGRPTRVQWRLLRSGNVWRVTDVAIADDGNQLWLAQQQQRDFLAALDRNHGDIRALISDVENLTARMRQRIMARN